MEQKKRKSTRFDPGPGTIAMIDLQGRESGEFRPTLLGLVFSEAFKGCGLIVLSRDGEIKVGDTWKVKVGKLSPMAAEIRWVKFLDEQVARIGLEYLESS
jgi:hypothetical protein